MAKACFEDPRCLEFPAPLCKFPAPFCANSLRPLCAHSPPSVLCLFLRPQRVIFSGQNSVICNKNKPKRVNAPEGFNQVFSLKHLFNGKK